MPRAASFWRNVAAIGLAHAAILVGLARWSGHAQKPAQQEILWLNGGATDGMTHAAVVFPTPAPIIEPTTIPDAESRDDEELEETAAETPVPTDVPLPTPQGSVSPSESPKPLPTPRASITPSPKPKPTPKKKAATKHSPTPKPKPSITPTKKSTPKPTPAEKTPTPSAISSPEPADVKSEDASTGTSSSGASGNGSGASRESKFAWYGNMLHDRFFSEWVQPKSVAPAGSKMSARVKLRIERDGRVSAFSIVRSSGNVVVDDSITAALKRVTRVDPPPRGLGGAFYEVTIKFELDLE